MLKGILDKFIFSKKVLDTSIPTNETETEFTYVLNGPISVVEKRDWSAWETLAETRGLYFKSDGLMGTVFGAYKGYSVKLMISYKFQHLIPEHTELELAIGAATHLLASKIEPERDLNSEDIHKLLAADEFTFSLKGSMELTEYGREIHYTQPRIETDVEYLRFLFELMYRIIAAYPKIVAQGGEMIPSLTAVAANEDYPLRTLVAQIIRKVAETTPRGERQISNVYCQKCLHLCVEHKVEFSWIDETAYFGCRACHHSKSFHKAQTLIAVLDTEMAELVSRQGQNLRINWLRHRALFDFESVEIVQATDEDVERFAVQVGNDTEEGRCRRYSQMDCVISPECQLTINTLRILKRTFGKVERSS